MPATNRLLFEAGGSFSAQILDREPQAESTQPTIVEQSNGLGYRAISTSAAESLVYLHQDVAELQRPRIYGTSPAATRSRSE